MQISYTVDTSRRKENLCEVTLDIDDFPDELMNVVMPAWVPGSYVIRDYSRKVRNLTATTGDGTALSVKKRDKGTWTLMHTKGEYVRVRYEIYTGDLIPQTSHIDDSHVYLLGTDIFMYIEGYKEQSYEVDIITPKDCRIFTSMDEVTHGKYRAIHYDALADSVTEIGNPEVQSFTVEGKQHDLIFCGFDGVDTSRISVETKKIVETVRDLFQYLPYNRYKFFFHLTDGNGGSGHEHSSSCSIMVGKSFLEASRYKYFLGVIAHEFFHVYNVKRLRPAEFDKFNYIAENYTTLLWLSEGFTSYYAEVILFRSGLIDEKEFFERLAESVRIYEMMPGKDVVSASSSSFDAWIRQYKPSPDDINTYISYYLKGSLIAFILNSHILQYSGNQKSLDDLMKLLWDHYRKDGKGFLEKDLLRSLKDITGNDFSSFFERYVNGTYAMDFDSVFSTLGYRLVKHRFGEADGSPGKASVGLLLRNEGGKFKVITPLMGYSSHGSGISPGDEMISCNDVLFSSECAVPLSSRFASSPFIDLVSVEDLTRPLTFRISRRGKVREYSLIASEAPYEKYQVEKIAGEKYKKVLEKFLRG